MSDQEQAVVAETSVAAVDETAQLASAESVAGSAETGVVPEMAQAANAPATPQIEPASEPTSSEESNPFPPSSAEMEEAASGDLSIHTLRVGQHFVGKVKNITDFGAFVDIGIPQDGLVHISKLSRRKVDKVIDVVSEGQEVDVWVKKVDRKRGRISLTMIKPITMKLKNVQEGVELEGIVTRLESYGAFVDIGSDRDGLVHISQVTHDYIKHPDEVLAVGDRVKVRVLKVNRKKRQVDLSIKALSPPPSPSVEEVKPVAEVKPTVEVVEEESSVPTAMALAYAAFQYGGQGEQSGDKDLELAKEKTRKKEEMDAIVARTLAARQE